MAQTLDSGFVRPLPEQLPRYAQQLRASGVRRLLVVLPHAPGALPQALQRGLASLDEQAVAALDFEHILFVRSPQAPAQAAGIGGLQRVAHWVLGQLQMMLPQQQQPQVPNTYETQPRPGPMPPVRPGGDPDQ